MPPIAHQVITYTVSSWQVTSQRKKGSLAARSTWGWIIVYNGQDLKKANSILKAAQTKGKAKMDTVITSV